MKTERIYFGAAYYSEYLPYDRVEQDMEWMEQAGMNTIRIAESTWSTIEPSDGVFDFTHLDKMLDAAARHHISVIIGTPTYAIPTWLSRKYPDILAVTADGPGLYGTRQNMDITHAGYLFHCERVIRAIMEHIRDIPHIIGFQLDNETKSYGTAGMRVQAMFVEELKKKYPDIRDFNHAFGLDYWSNRVNTWEDFPDIRGTINESLAAEFKCFQRKLVTDFLSWQAGIVSEYKRPDQFITHNFDYEWTGQSIGYQPEVNQYEAAKCMTVAGCDIYHPSQSALTGEEINFCGNITRSLKNDNYLVMETQAQGNIAWLPYPGQLRLQAYSHLANGSNSVMYWHWHSIHNSCESYWKGVLSHDFSKNRIYEEASVIGKEFCQIGDHLKNLKKENRIALLLDNASLTGLSLFPLKDTGEHSYSTVTRWIGDTLYRMNLEFDMVSSENRDFSGYAFLIVPALYSASDSLLEAISDYVKNGGHLITTFRTGFSDEQLKIYADVQPHGLTKCLGIHYDQYTYPENVTVRYPDLKSLDLCSISSDKTERNATYTGRNSSGQSLFPATTSESKASVTGTCRHWMDLVTCDTASPILFYEHPVWNTYAAATVNQYGAGSALYLASMFDRPVLEALLTDFFATFSDQLPADSGCHFPVICKTGTNDYGKAVTYYLNYSDQETAVCYHGADGVNLFTSESVTSGSSIVLPAWGVSIIEA